jgi:hypothetical protein
MTLNEPDATPNEAVAHGCYSLEPAPASIGATARTIRRQDPDRKRTVAVVHSLEEWGYFVAAIEAGMDEVAAVHAIDHAIDEANRARRLTAGQLPSFDEARFAAYSALGDVVDMLRSDWRKDGAPTRAQAQAVSDAIEHIGAAKGALNRAA